MNISEGSRCARCGAVYPYQDAACPLCGHDPRNPLPAATHQGALLKDVDWVACRRHFEPNGKLLDVIILGHIDLIVWGAVLEALRTSATSLTFSVDGVTTPLPSSAYHLVHRGDPAVPVLLTFEFAGIRFSCTYFDSYNAISFSFAANDIDGPGRLEWLAEFMKVLGNRTKRDVQVSTPMGAPEYWPTPILGYSAGSGAFQWL